MNARPFDKNLAFLISAILLLCAQYVGTVVRYESAGTYESHMQVMGGTEEDPIRYRVLVYLIAHASAQILPFPYGMSILIAHHALSLVALSLLVIQSYRLFRRFVTPERALIGALFLCLSFNVIFLRQTAVSYSWWDAVFLTTGVLWLHSRYWSPSPR